MLLKDSVVALVTPFKEDYTIDIDSFKSIIDFQLHNNTSGIIVGGTTGESSTLLKNEKLELLKIAKDMCHSKIPVFLAIGYSNTLETILLAKEAKEQGVDGLLIVTPSYNKPSQEGLYLHYSLISHEVSLPIYMYNIESRTGVNLELETIYRLVEKNPNIIGIKDCSTDFLRILKMKKHLGKNFSVLTGDDSNILSAFANGADGCISVVANIIPKSCNRLHKLWKEGYNKELIQLHTKLIGLTEALFLESNPSPIKYAMEKMGLIHYNIRLPLTKVRKSTQDKIEEELKILGLI